MKPSPSEVSVLLDDLIPLKIYAEGIGIKLDVWQIEKFYHYTRELMEWNAKINITSLKRMEDIIIQHYMDSITPGAYLSGIKNVMDLGTGAGFPGIPLKISRPELELVLVEAKRRRISFLRNIVIGLSLENVHLYHGRAEDKGFYEKHRERMDVVITRASLKTREILEVGRWLVKRGGQLCIMKGEMGLGEQQEVEMLIEKSGSSGWEIIPYTLPGMRKKRNLIIITK